jgi:hypothetical protein
MCAKRKQRQHQQQKCTTHELADYSNESVIPAKAGQAQSAQNVQKTAPKG